MVDLAHWHTEPVAEGGNWRAAATTQKELKKHRFCRHDVTTVLRDLRYSLNKPLKSTDD
jgi:hypothetical protein